MKNNQYIYWNMYYLFMKINIQYKHLNFKVIYNNQLIKY